MTWEGPNTNPNNNNNNNNKKKHLLAQHVILMELIKNGRYFSKMEEKEKKHTHIGRT